MLRALPCVCFFKELTLYFKCSRFIAKCKDGSEFPSALDPVSAVVGVLLEGAAFAVSLTHHMVFRALAVPCFLVLVALKSSGIWISCPAPGLYIVLLSLLH